MQSGRSFLEWISRKNVQLVIRDFCSVMVTRCDITVLWAEIIASNEMMQKNYFVRNRYSGKQILGTVLCRGRWATRGVGGG